MRKWMALLAAVCLCVSMVACRSGQAVPSTGETETFESQDTTEATEAQETTNAPEVPETTEQTAQPQVPQQSAPERPDADASLHPGEDPADRLDQVSDY